MAEVPKQLKPFLFKPGNKLGGRKKGKTMKEYARDYLKAMSDKERTEFLNSIDQDMIWRMAEGNPHSTEDITSGGKPLPLFDYVKRKIRDNDSDGEATETSKEN